VKPPLFRSAAAADIEDAYLWYEARQLGLGGEFLETVKMAVESISQP
jgi:hypothetical protein